MKFVGFDPGGRNRFGWAVLTITDSGMPQHLCTGLGAHAGEAMRNAAQPTDEVPTAVGIDAPLYWVAAADRKADQQIRKRLCAAGGRSGTVNHVKKLGDWLVELHDLAGTLALFIPVQVDKQLTQHE